MGCFLIVDDFIVQFGEVEVCQIVGLGDFNLFEGSQIDYDVIEVEIVFIDELIVGYVFVCYFWVNDQDVVDMLNFFKGFGGDIICYCLCDKEGGKGQVFEIVEICYKDVLKCFEVIQQGKLDLLCD